MPAPLTAADLQAAQTADNQWLGGFLQQLQSWQAGRDPYYAALEQQYRQAQLPGLQTQVRQAGRQQAFSARRRGVVGGSSDMAGKQGVQGMLSAGLGQIEAGGRALSQQKRAEDQEAMQGWEMAARSAGPGQQIALQSMLDASRARAGQAGGMGDVATQMAASNQAYQGLISQLLGGQLSNLGTALNTSAQSGNAPGWLANFGRG